MITDYRGNCRTQLSVREINAKAHLDKDHLAQLPIKTRAIPRSDAKPPVQTNRPTKQLIKNGLVPEMHQSTAAWQ